MNTLIQRYFQVGENNFQEVIFLGQEMSWEEISEKSPTLPKGWFELSRISPEDRVEFTRDYWLEQLPYHPKTHAAFSEFFDQIDDIAVIAAREGEGPLLPELAYSLEDNSCFFRGRPPASEEDWDAVREEISVPHDYLAFTKVHNGFGKLSEMGLLEIEKLPEAKREIMDLILFSHHLVKSGERAVDPGSLTPFYEAFGLASYQCFYSDWYPTSEMGNVYFSGIDYTISDTSDKKSLMEELAFPTFLDWLVYYLQGMSIAP